MSANANKVIVIALLGGIVAFFLHVAGKALAAFCTGRSGGLHCLAAGQ